MSKLSFRARALDSSKPLPIYHADDLPDLSDYSTINRTVPQMPTGMEKEEESERHLQDVIQAKQANSNKKKHVYIPTPAASIPVEHYEEITKQISRGYQYVRVPGLGLEEVPDYDLDSEDEEWLNAQSNERPLSQTHFECMMDKLEKGSGNTVLSEREAQGLLRDDENLVLAVYDYWLAKRLRLGRSLIPFVKQEGRDSGSGSNPYIAFRKRTEKMQTRKNRKNDEQAFMQMLKLKRDLAKAVSLFEWVKEREQKKEELSKIQLNVFRKRYKMEDWSGTILSSLSASSKSRRSSQHSDWDYRSKVKLSADYEAQHGRNEGLLHTGSRKKKKRKNFPYSDVHSEAPLTPSTPDKFSHDLSSDRLELDDFDGPFSFKRKPHVKYHSYRDTAGVWPWSNELPPSTAEPQLDSDPMILDYTPYSIPHAASRERAKTSTVRMNYRFSRTSLCNGKIGLSRRRLGRGGRSVWDRLNLRASLDDELASISPTPSAAPIPYQQTMPDEECTHDDNASLHFIPQSPSSQFEFLSFIEKPGNSSDLSVPSRPSSAMSGLSLAFRGLPPGSELREDAKTFSSLPTSQFFLRSLSSDVDYQGSLLSVDSPWGLVRDSRQRTTSEHSYNSPLHSPSTPSNNSSFTTDQDKTKQVLNDSEQIKELSRSSLSVADSKTIVLSLPRPKHQLEKSQRLSVSSESEASKPVKQDIKASPKPSGTGSSSKQVNVEPKPTETRRETLPDAASRPEHTDPAPQIISTPSDCIKGFDNVSIKSRPNTGLRKKSKTLIASLTTATLITTQLGLFQASKKKETPRQVLQPSIPNTSSSGSGDMIVSASSVPTTTLSAAKLAEIQSSLIGIQDKSEIGSGLTGFKTTISTTVPNATSLTVASNNHVGSLSPVTSGVARRGSTGTNGTNNIFHSATRRISETADRGLKQALVGMNHNSLLETANSLVQLSNSSEVT